MNLRDRYKLLVKAGIGCGMYFAGLELVRYCESYNYWLAEVQIAEKLLWLLVLPGWALLRLLELHCDLYLPEFWGWFVSFTVYGLLWGKRRNCRPADIDSGLPGTAEFRRSKLVTRRQVLYGGALIVGGTLTYGYMWEAKHVEFVRRKLMLPGISPSLVGLRLVALSDLHRGPCTDFEYLSTVVRRVNQMEPDLVLIPGDFVSYSAEYFDDVYKLLSGLSPSIAVLGTLGNHDHWVDEARAREVLMSAGVVCIENTHVVVTPEKRLQSSRERGNEGLYIAGVGDLWEGRVDVRSAVEGIPASQPRILLSHNPDVAELGPAQDVRVDLQISGHTHGGQVLIPGIGAVVTASRYGTKYLSGLNEGPSWPVYTMRGVGTTALPVRLGAPPEVVVFEVVADNSTG